MTFIKDDQGAATHVVIDWQKYGDLIGTILEELEDEASIAATAGEETISLADVRAELLKAGASEQDLSEIHKRDV